VKPAGAEMAPPPGMMPPMNRPPRGPPRPSFARRPTGPPPPFVGLCHSRIFFTTDDALCFAPSDSCILLCIRTIISALSHNKAQVQANKEKQKMTTGWDRKAPV